MRDPTNPSQVPFQDYAITVPDLGPGNAVLYVAHASIVGVGALNSSFMLVILMGVWMVGEWLPL